LKHIWNKSVFLHVYINIVTWLLRFNYISEKKCVRVDFFFISVESNKIIIIIINIKLNMNIFIMLFSIIFIYFNNSFIIEKI